MSTPSAKRALNFGTNSSSKRRKTNNTMVLYRGIKPEMKHKHFPIAYSGAATSYNLCINAVPTGNGFAERIGAKLKVWNIEYLFHESNGLDPTLRLDVYLGDTNTDFSTHTLDDPLPRQTYTSLKTMMLYSGSNPNSQGATGNIKLPLGVVTRFTDGAATSINSNSIHIRFTSSVATTVGGYFRIWYTDA